MGTRKASIKETGEEVSQEDWARFDRAVESEAADRPEAEPFERDTAEHEPTDKPSRATSSTVRPERSSE